MRSYIALWIVGCLTSALFCVMVNVAIRSGLEPLGVFVPGSLISCMFTLAVDVLGRLLARSKERGLLEWCLVGSDDGQVSHLQYVNDTIFLCYLDLATRI